MTIGKTIDSSLYYPLTFSDEFEFKSASNDISKTNSDVKPLGKFISVTIMDKSSTPLKLGVASGGLYLDNTKESNPFRQNKNVEIYLKADAIADYNFKIKAESTSITNSPV